VPADKTASDAILARLQGEVHEVTAGRHDQQQRQSKRHRGRARHGCNQKVKCTTPPPGASTSSTGTGKGGAYEDGVEALRRAPRAAASEGEVHDLAARRRIQQHRSRQRRCCCPITAAGLIIAGTIRR